MLFTPVNADGTERLRMELSEEDSRKIKRGRYWKAKVTDQLTGKRYQVRAASCGSPRCRCDARVVCEETSNA